MTVEQKIKKIVDSMEGVSYLFDNWQTANIRLDKIKLPAVLNLLPVSGTFNLGRQEHVTALTALVDNVLDPLRTWWGKPITVNSGYRCLELNAAVKGSKTSQHMKGEAADIDTGDRQQNKLLFEYIRKNLPYDQLIDESNFAWVHVSYRADGDNRMQVLKL